MLGNVRRQHLRILTWLYYNITAMAVNFYSNMIWTMSLINSWADSNINKRKDILTIKHVSDEN